MCVDLEESKATVSKRLELIEGEIKKIEVQIGLKQGEQTTIGEEIGKMQQQMQSDAVTAAKQIAAGAN